MTAIGSLVFCNDCGELLEARTTAKRTKLKCSVCGTFSKDTSDKVVISRSKPADFPSPLRDKRSEVQGVREEDVRQDAITHETCEKCGKDEIRFYQQQTRSADEGSTVVYTCVNCGHGWIVNN